MDADQLSLLAPDLVRSMLVFTLLSVSHILSTVFRATMLTTDSILLTKLSSLFTMCIADPSPDSRDRSYGLQAIYL